MVVIPFPSVEQKPGYPKASCSNLYSPGSLMFVGPSATPVQCLWTDYVPQFATITDLKADVCSTQALRDYCP
jgi:hypothetical protein